jgi:GH25 family lysozyme M1 (1,4-beta-N-acetylmuramidase)
MLAVDVSHWSGDVDFALMKLHGVDLFIPKLTQGNYLRDSEVDEYLKDLRRDKLDFGVFHYDDPDITVGRQVDWIRKNLPADAKFLALDIEKTGPRKGVKYNPLTLDAHIRALYDGCAGLGLPLLVYTRMSYVTSYCPTLLPWLKTKRNWIAAYPELRTLSERLLGKKGIKLSWIGLKGRMLRVGRPITPSGITCVLHQFSGDVFILPGCKKTLDINMADGSFADWKERVLK